MRALVALSLAGTAGSLSRVGVGRVGLQQGVRASSSGEGWAESELWADAVSAFDEEELEGEEEAYYGLSPPRPDAPTWLHGAIVAAGYDVEMAMAPLTERETDVLLERYWLGGPSTQLECAMRLDMSLTRVAQLERAARRKLETTAEVERLEDDSARRALAEGSLMLTLFERQVGYFYFRDELRVDEATLSRLLAQHGPVLAQRRDTLKRKGERLRASLALDDDRLRTLVSRQPTILGLNADALDAKLAWLREALGVDEAALGDAVLRGAGRG